MKFEKEDILMIIFIILSIILTILIVKPYMDAVAAYSNITIHSSIEEVLNELK